MRSTGPFRDSVLSILATIAKQERIRIIWKRKEGDADVSESSLKMGGSRFSFSGRRAGTAIRGHPKAAGMQEFNKNCHQKNRPGV